jgi:hypothetical protein
VRVFLLYQRKWAAADGDQPARFDQAGKMRIWRVARIKRVKSLLSGAALLPCSRLAAQNPSAMAPSAPTRPSTRDTISAASPKHHHGRVRIHRVFRKTQSDRAQTWRRLSNTRPRTAGVVTKHRVGFHSRHFPATAPAPCQGRSHQARATAGRCLSDGVRLLSGHGWPCFSKSRPAFRQSMLRSIAESKHNDQGQIGLPAPKGGTNEVYPTEAAR